MPRNSTKTGRWYYGWNIVGAVFIFQMVAMGASTGMYGIFVVPVSTELETSRFTATLGYTLIMVGMSIVSPIAGQLMQRGSIRLWIMFGGASMAAGLLLAGSAGDIYQYLALYGTLIAVGAVFSGAVPATTLVVNWFSAERGRALGIATIGASAGGLFLPLIASLLIDLTGWRNAYRLLAAGSAMLIIPLAWWLVSNRPSDRGLEADDAPMQAGGVGPTSDNSVDDSIRLTRILGTPAFWAISLFGGLGSAVYGGVLVNIVPFAIELGHDRGPAAWIITLMTAGMIGGKLIIGYASDFVAPHRLALLALSTVAVGAVLLATVSQLIFLFLACLLVGLGSGGYYPLIGMLISQVFSRDVFSKVIGLVLPVLYLVAMWGPPIAGHTYDAVGSYAPAFWIYTAFLVSAALLMKLLGGRFQGPQAVPST